MDTDPVMLRALVLLVLVLLLSSMPARAEGDRQAGKTDAEILAMDREAWVDYYASHVSGSHASWTASYYIYAEVLRRRNDHLPPRNHSAEFESLLNDFGERAVSINDNLDGGGNIWANVYGRANCDAEQTVFGLLAGKTEPAHLHTVSQVRHQIRALEQRVDRERTRPRTTFFNITTATTDLHFLRADWAKIQQLVSTLGRKDARLVLDFCVDYLTASV